MTEQKASFLRDHAADKFPDKKIILDAGEVIPANQGQLFPKEILDHMPQGFVMFDHDRNLVVWNKQYETAMDFPEGFLEPGMPCREMTLFIARRGDLGKGDPKILCEGLMKQLWVDNASRMELEIGGKKTYDVSISQPEQGGLILSYCDITTHQKSENVLRRSEQRFRTLYHQSPTGVSLEDYSMVKLRIDLLDADGIYDLEKHLTKNENDLREVLNSIQLLDANNTLIEMLGASSFEDLKKFDESLVTFANANWRRFYIGEISAFANGESTYSDDFLDFKMDGTPIHIKCTSRIVQGCEGDWSEIISIHEDITARKLAEEKLERHRIELKEQVEERTAKLVSSEERFRTIAETASDWFWETDDKFCFSFISERFFEVTKIQPEEVLGKSRLDFITSDHWKRNPKKWQRHKEDLEAHRPFSIRYQVFSQSGRRSCIEIKGKPFFDSDNRFLGFRGAGTDVTATVLAEEQLKKAKDIADAANKAKSEFLASMSHELRTPLNAIIGFSSTIRDQVFGPVNNPKYIDYSNDIFNSGNHLLDLINDILDVSAIEAGKVELLEEVIEIADVITSSLHLISQRANEGKISVGTNLPEYLPSVRADERRVKQILINLLTNAVKFTPENGSISIASSLDQDGAIVLSVTDTGVGMTNEELAHAMTKFGQVDGDPERKNEGTGLGLTLTKGLIELHDGQFQIESKKSQGTKVSVIFPPERVMI